MNALIVMTLLPGWAPQIDGEAAAAKVLTFARRVGYREPLELTSTVQTDSAAWLPGTKGKLWSVGYRAKGGAWLSANVGQDGKISYFCAQKFPVRPTGRRPFDAKDAERAAWGFIRAIPHRGPLRIDRIAVDPKGAGGAQFHLLVNGRRFYNLNPTYGYYMNFDLSSKRVTWFGSREDVPPVNAVQAKIPARQAYDRFIKYAMNPGQDDSVVGLLSPKWPTKMRLRPDLGYYKWKDEPQARLVYRGVVEPENWKGPGTHSMLKAFVDAQSGELLIPDDQGWG
jgi:hypothetical protein